MPNGLYANGMLGPLSSRNALTNHIAIEKNQQNNSNSDLKRLHLNLKPAL